MQPGHQPLGGERRGDANGQGIGCAGELRLLHGFGKAAKPFPQFRQAGLSHLGEPQLPVEAVEKPYAQMAFQGFDLLANGRGGDMEFFSGILEA